MTTFFSNEIFEAAAYDMYNVSKWLHPAWFKLGIVPYRASICVNFVRSHLWGVLCQQLGSRSLAAFRSSCFAECRTRYLHLAPWSLCVQRWRLEIWLDTDNNQKSIGLDLKVAVAKLCSVKTVFLWSFWSFGCSWMLWKGGSAKGGDDIVRCDAPAQFLPSVCCDVLICSVVLCFRHWQDVWPGGTLSTWSWHKGVGKEHVRGETRPSHPF